MGEEALPFGYSAGSHPHSPGLNIAHHIKGGGHFEESCVSKA